MVSTRKNGTAPARNGVRLLLSELGGESPLKGKTPVVVPDVPLDRIAHTSFNPAGRTVLDTKDMASLVRSVGAVGVLSFPIAREIAGGRYELADGNRRLAAAREAGQPHLTLAVYDLTDKELAVVYAQLNDRHHQKSHTARERLEAWLSNPNAVTGAAASNYAGMRALVGRNALQAIVKSGKSPHVVNQARWVAKFCGRPNHGPLVRKAVSWIIKHQMTFKVRNKTHALNVNPAVLLTAVETNKPLPATH